MRPWWNPSTDDSWLGAPRFDLEDFIVLTGRMWGAAAVYNAPPELQRYVVGAGSAYQWGIGVDYALKRYMSDAEFGELLSEEQQPIYDATNTVKIEVVKALALAGSEKRDGCPGQFAAENALVRLQTTFQGASLMIRHGRHFEAAALERLILEQLAWAYAVHDCRDDSYFKVMPTSCIKSLKALVPTAGWLYGHLTHGAHISPRETTDYITGFEDGAYIVHIHQPELAPSDAFLLLVLADWFGVIAEVVCEYAVSTHDRAQRNESGQWMPNPQRPMVGTLREFREKLGLRNLEDMAPSK